MPKPTTTLRIAAAALAVWCGPRAQDGVSSEGLFSLPRSQDAIAELEAARADLAADRAAAAAQRLHRVLNEFDFGVAPTLAGVERWQGVRLAALELLRDLPGAGREAYERIVRREAGALFDADPTQLSDDDLRWLAERFPAAVAGRRARLRLADRALAAGAAIDAVVHVRAALDATAVDHPERAAIEQRMAIAGAAVAMRWGGAAGPAVDGDTIAATVADALVDRGHPGWPAFGGGYRNARPMQPPAGDRPATVLFPIQADGFETNDFAMHAVGDLDGIYIDDGHSIHAIDPISGQLAWRWDGPVLGTDDLYEARDAVNQHVPLVAATSADLVIGALQVPNDIVGAAVRQSFREAISIINKIPSRRLFAIDRATGKLVWSHWDGEDGRATERFAGHEACGAPLVHGDTVLCATHDPSGAIAFYLSAYDLHTGAPRWRTLICSSQQEVNMFGNARQEFAAGGLAVADGVVHGVTNLGVAFAADLADGSVRWITAYDTIPLPRTRLRDQESRPVFFASSPPVLCDGVLVATPLDSEYVIGIDTASGRQLWRMRHDALPDVRLRWLLGVLGDEVVVAGNGVATIRARPGDDRPPYRLLAAPATLGESYYSSVARGAIVGDRIWYVGSDGRVTVLDRDGRRDPSAAPAWSSTGNLLLVDGVAAQVKDGAVRIHADLEGLGRAARLALRERPDDPALLLRIATLEHALAADDLGGVRGARAIEAYRLGLEAARAAGLGPGARIHERLARGLFRAAFDRARVVAASRPAAGLELLLTARDGAPDARSWLTAQRAVLGLVAGDPQRALAELELATRLHGDAMFEFEDAGKIPVAVWAKWQSLGHLQDPAQRARVCQELLARHGEVTFGTATIRELATRRIQELIDAHGRGIYAAIEAEAEDRLEAAGDDRAALAALTAAFPHSAAADRAATRLLDLAVTAGDAGAALRSFAARLVEGPPSAPVLRRALAAAVEADNLALAHALGARLAAEHGGAASDFGPDAGADYAAVVAALPPLPLWRAAKPSRPEAVASRIQQPNLQTLLSFVPLDVPRGFAAASPLPLLVARDEADLAVFRLTDGPPTAFDQHAFRVPIEEVGRRASFHLCAGTLVVVQRDGARGYSIDDGRELWRVPAGPDRDATSLGVTAGVLHVFTEVAATAGDGGVLCGIEPVTGAVLFRHAFPVERPSVPPVVTAGALWTLDADAPAGPVFHCHDPVDFRIVESTPLPNDARDALSLGAPHSHRLRHSDVQTEFVADDLHVYLGADPSEPQRPARVAAIRRGEGRTVWVWSGTAGLRLWQIAAHDGLVSVFERSSRNSRLVTLDARDRSELRAVDFEQGAEVFHWPDTPRETVPADTVVVADDPRGTRLTWLPLDPRRGRHFAQDFPEVGQVSPSPLRGDDFTLVVLRSRRARAAEIHVLEPSSTRQGALPGGRSTLTLDLEGTVRAFAHDGRVVLQSISGLHLLTSAR